MHQVVVVREVAQMGHRIAACVRCVWGWRRMMVVVPLVGRVLVMVQRQWMRLALERRVSVRMVWMVRSEVGRGGSDEHRCRGADVRGGREGGGRDRVGRGHDRVDAQRRRLAIE